MRVALVHPPFAPAGLPNLGLSLLQAGVRARGIACRTFYWSHEVLRALPGSEPERTAHYRALTGRPFHPYNEWAFSRALHGDALDAREPELRRAYFERHGDGAPALARGRAVLLLRERAEELVDAAADRLADATVVGIASSFFQNVPALALARRLKARWPEKIVVLGGANADGGMGQALLELFPFLDGVFQGEVDHAFPEFVTRLAEGRSTDDVPGLVRRCADGLRAGPPAPPLADLDALPLPDFDDYVEAFLASGLARQSELTLALESSRGCWWGERSHCTFCGLNAEGMQYRVKGAERFLWEAEELLRRHGARFLFMTDNILSPRYDERLAEWASARRVAVDFFYEIKANTRRARLERLALAGVTAVQPGIESLSPRVLRLMRKGVTPIHNVAFLKHARELGLLAAYNLLVGSPGETADDYRPLLELVPKLGHLQPPAAVAPIEYHRFSPYHRDPAAFGLELRPHRGYASLHPFPTDELRRIAYFFEPQETAAPPEHAGPFARRVLEWCRDFREDDCTLTMADEGARIVVVDRRAGLGPRRFHLHGFAARLLRELREVRALSELLRVAETERGSSGPFPASDEAAVVLAFTADAFLEDPEACLAPLVDAALVLEERGEAASDRALLALPVSSSWRRIRQGWLRTSA